MTAGQAVNSMTSGAFNFDAKPRRVTYECPKDPTKFPSQLNPSICHLNSLNQSRGKLHHTTLRIMPAR